MSFVWHEVYLRTVDGETHTTINEMMPLPLDLIINSHLTCAVNKWRKIRTLTILFSKYFVVYLSLEMSLTDSCRKQNDQQHFNHLKSIFAFDWQIYLLVSQKINGNSLTFTFQLNISVICILMSREWLSIIIIIILRRNDF